MEVMKDTEDDIITIEDIKGTTPIEAEADSKTTKTMGSQSTRMTEATCFMIFMETQFTPPKSKMQLLPFILQAWKVTENMTEDKDPIQD